MARPVIKTISVVLADELKDSVALLRNRRLKAGIQDLVELYGDKSYPELMVFLLKGLKLSVDEKVFKKNIWQFQKMIG